MELRNQVFISKFDILKNESEILGNLSELEKRNKQFDDLLSSTKVDQKHQFYEDEVINPIEGELYVKDIVAPNKLYQGKVADWVESYFDEKYTDLEEKKKEAEGEFDAVQQQNYKDYYENKPEGWKPIEVENVLNNQGYANGYNSFYGEYDAPRPQAVDPPAPSAPQPPTHV